MCTPTRVQEDEKGVRQLPFCARELQSGLQVRRAEPTGVASSFTLTSE